MPTRRTALPQITRMPKSAHPGLWYDRYIMDIEASATGEGPSAKDTLLTELESYTSAPGDPYTRMYNVMHANLARISMCDTRTATTRGRLVIGMGADSVLETGIALHRTYGVPYLPGSALKGLAAAYAAQYAGPEWASESPAYLALFGSQERAGVVDFLDALWEPQSGAKPFAPDIMSVHQFAYYSEEAHAPSDREKLNIVSFLTVGTGQTFVVPIVGPERWRNAAFQLLEQAMLHRGIGAKTNAGYGRLEMAQKLDPDALAAAPLLTQIDAVAVAQAKSMLGQIAGRMTKDIREKKLTPRAARMVAEAIVAKAEVYKLEKSSLWYIDLIKFLQTPS